MKINYFTAAAGFLSFIGIAFTAIPAAPGWLKVLGSVLATIGTGVTMYLPAVMPETVPDSLHADKTPPTA